MMLQLSGVPAIQVHLTSNGEKTSIYTTAKTLQELVSERKLDIGEHDLIEPSLNLTLVEEMQIIFKKSTLFLSHYVVMVKEKEVWTTSTTNR
ncbi:DUF348 domain-containing protein [Anaerobacillus sp. HL2]|nr:DUF348 domain-containing protein [Anaerobacillus sp. HL2]